MIRRGRGGIMLVASTAAFLPGPYMAVYFASKAYVLSLGEALAEETRGTGVTVSVLCPGATDTEFFAVAEAGNTLMAHRLRRMMSAAAVARLGVRGLAAGRRVVIAGLLNRVLVLGVRYAPHWLTVRVAGRLMAKN
jgi:short-subunit dehydrogenase